MSFTEGGFGWFWRRSWARFQELDAGSPGDCGRALVCNHRGVRTALLGHIRQIIAHMTGDALLRHILKWHCSHIDDAGRAADASRDSVRCPGFLN